MKYKVMENERKTYNEQGFLLIKGFFPIDEIQQICIEAKTIFASQMERLKIATVADINDDEKFTKAMYELFRIDMQAFVNCGKQCQHLISLHRLSLSDKIVNKLIDLGLSFPNISTRPVMYFNSPHLAKEAVYHTVFPHQDWRSMQGSLDAVVCWLPLVAIDKTLGALEVLPTSHKRGLLTESVDHGFGKVNVADNDEKMFLPVEVNPGDALFFSSFLIHRSGNNTNNKIRWSTHFRYNNLNESTFIERKYAHPYIYKPQDELITPDFPQVSDLFKIFN
jgi:ectoine hydroxylase-related dioxygenase (phytanoyl-CoA dioxygenase family)